MPSVAQEALDHGDRANGGSNAHHGLSVLAKKRRWEEGRSSADDGYHGGDVVSIMLHDENGECNESNINCHHRATTTTSTATLTRAGLSPSQRKIIPLGSKRLRLSSGSGDDCRLLKASAVSHTSAHGHHAHPPMTPCHVCHRRPRRKCDLDSLADCEGCGQRTCFVCLRECPGWAAAAGSKAQTPIEERHEDDTRAVHQLSSSSPSTGWPGHHKQPWSMASHGHRRMVCSRCCVERGEDGDVVCLGCVAFRE